MSRRSSALLLACVLTVLALFGVAGHSRISGPVLVSLTRNHGVHAGDLIVVACWAAGMLLCWKLAATAD